MASRAGERGDQNGGLPLKKGKEDWFHFAQVGREKGVFPRGGEGSNDLDGTSSVKKG